MNDSQAVALVRLANALWPAAKPLDSATARAWGLVLADTEFEAARAALLRMATDLDVTGQARVFAPSVGQIVAAAKPPKPSPQPDACDCGDDGCACRAAGLCDRGWLVEITAGGRWQARPCGRCRPVAYRLWEAGHFGCPHRRTCPTCQAIVSQGGGRAR